MSRITGSRPYSALGGGAGGGSANGGASNNTATTTIGANEDMFLKAFDQTPKLEVGTQKKLEMELQRVMVTISNPNAQWDNRVQAIKHLRTLIKSGIDGTEYFYTNTLKSLEIPFQNNLCDLRSQVVRETCITIAFLSCRMQQKFAKMSEMLMPSLIKLIPNSAKIISTSALVAIRFIIQSTHYSRLIPIFKYQLSTSKSKDIHRALCEIVERIVTLWPPSVIERQLQDFVEVLRLGICNSDESARQYARRAFNGFAENFKESADRLYNSLDQQRQRMLNNLHHGGGSTLTINDYGSNNIVPVANYQTPISHSSNNLNGNSHQTGNSLARLKSSLHYQNNGTTTTNGSMTTTSSYKNHLASPSPSRIRTPTARSTSAIDVAAQKRAMARAVYLSSMHTQARKLVQPTSSSQPASNPSTPQQPASHYQSLQPQSTPHQPSPYQLALQHHQQTPTANNQTHNMTPNVAQQQKELQELQKEQSVSAEKKDGGALRKSAEYLSSVIGNESIGESQIVTTLRYFNSLIETHPKEVISELLPDIMPPLVVGVNSSAICIRKESVFAMVAVHAKVGLPAMHTYLVGLASTPRKLIEVYIDKSRKESSG